MESKTPYEVSPLRSLRLQAKMTQVELSKRTGVAQCVISDLEHGRREFTWGWARQIARSMGMSAAELMMEVHGDYAITGSHPNVSSNVGGKLKTSERGSKR